MGKIRIEDLVGREISYRCHCGRRIAVPLGEVVAESRDYCGCGRVSITLADPEDVTDYQRILGPPKIDK